MADVSTAALFALAIVDWYVAFRLIGLARCRPPIGALTERAFRSVIVAIVATAIALLSVDDHHAHLLTDAQWHLAVTALVLVLSVPALVWLWMFWRGRLSSGPFGDRDIDEEHP